MTSSTAKKHSSIQTESAPPPPRLPDLIDRALASPPDQIQASFWRGRSGSWTQFDRKTGEERDPPPTYEGFDGTPSEFFGLLERVSGQVLAKKGDGLGFVFGESENGYRGKEHVRTIYGITIDADVPVGERQLQTILDALESWGLGFCLQERAGKLHIHLLIRPFDVSGGRRALFECAVLKVFDLLARALGVEPDNRMAFPEQQCFIYTKVTDPDSPRPAPRTWSGEGQAIDLNALLTGEEIAALSGGSRKGRSGSQPSSRRKTKKRIPPHVRITDEQKERSRARLQNKCDIIRRLPPPPKELYPTVNGAAYGMGQYVPHILPRELVEAELNKALEVFEHCPEFKGTDYYAAVIQRGIDDGMSERWWPGPEYSASDTGNGERYAELCGDEVRYVTTWKKWLVWDGKRWALDGAEAKALNLTKKVIEELYREANECEDPDQAKFLRARALAAEGLGARKRMLEAASAEDGMGIHHAALDRDPWLFNVRNGIVDLRTGVHHPHDPASLLTKVADCEYHPDALCPRWEAFLLECMDGDAELVAFLQVVAGYCLTGDVREQCLFFLFGDGANGKSTFVAMLLAVLGDYATAGAPNLLLRKRHEAHPTGQADLHGVRLVSCQEVSQGSSWDEPLLKMLTGGDRVKARRMREDFWEFSPTHKFIVSGNYRPNVSGTDDGIWRRLKLVPFEVSFKDKPDKRLTEKLMSELPGILAWAVRGCLRWQEKGLVTPHKIAAATDTYRKEQDVFGQFIEDKCELDPKAWTSNKDLRQAYGTWGLETGEDRYSFGSKGFAAGLERHGVISERRSVRGYRGIRLRTDKGGSGSGVGPLSARIAIGRGKAANDQGSNR